MQGSALGKTRASLTALWITLAATKKKQKKSSSWRNKEFLPGASLGAEKRKNVAISAKAVRVKRSACPASNQSAQKLIAACLHATIYAPFATPASWRKSRQSNSLVDMSSMRIASWSFWSTSGRLSESHSPSWAALAASSLSKLTMCLQWPKRFQSSRSLNRRSRPRLCRLWRSKDWTMMRESPLPVTSTTTTWQPSLKQRFRSSNAPSVPRLTSVVLSTASKKWEWKTQRERKTSSASLASWSKWVWAETPALKATVPKQLTGNACSAAL